MANLPETDAWPAGVYQIEQTDPVVGGAPNEASGAGLVNIPHLQLARRTFWLKTRVDALVAAVVAATTAVAGIVRLNTSVNSTSTTEAATPSAVKAANDNANSRALASRTIAAGGIATGGGDLTANRTITVPAATQAEAQAGVDNTKAMTPLRVAQAISQMVVAASDAVAGIVRLTSSITSTSETVAASALAVQRVAEIAAAKAPAGRTISTSGLALGGGDLTANRTIGVPASSRSAAEAGTDHTTAMTPLRVAQAIAALVPAASTTIAGLARLSAALNSDSAATAATSSAVKAANDNANGRALASRTVTGGGDLTANRTITVPEATAAEAVAGESGASAMTPRRTASAISTLTLGRAQDWVTPARSPGIVYQNTIGCPIMVIITSSAEHRVQVSLDSET